jgi:hypothetical protein
MLALGPLWVNSRQRRRSSKSELAIPERASAWAASLQGIVKANNRRGGGGGKAACTAKVALTCAAQSGHLGIPLWNNRLQFLTEKIKDTLED